MFTTIFSIVFLLLAMVSVIPGILKARTQHWSEALVKAVLTLVAAVLTVILTAALSPKLSYALVGPISSALDGTAIAEIFAEMASSDDAMAILLSLIITPFVFILFFLILKLIFLFVARPLTKLCLSVAGKIAKKDFVK